MSNFFGGPPATHKSIPMDEIMLLAKLIAAKWKETEEPVTKKLLLEISETSKLPLSHCYAAAGRMNVPFEEGADSTSFIVCVGECQRSGAMECLEHLLELQDSRESEGKPSFSIQARGCLNRCMTAPVVAVNSPSGPIGIAYASIDKIDQLLLELDAEDLSVG